MPDPIKMDALGVAFPTPEGDAYIDMKFEGSLDKICPLCGKDLVQDEKQPHILRCPDPIGHYSYHRLGGSWVANVDNKLQREPPACPTCGPANVMWDSRCGHQRWFCKTCGEVVDPNADAMEKLKTFKEVVDLHLGEE